MKVKDLVFNEEHIGDNDVCYRVYTDVGRFTILDRETGYSYGVRDIETGYKDNNGKFWLVSGMFDIRAYPELTLEEAILMIKDQANTCKGV